MFTLLIFLHVAGNPFGGSAIISGFTSEQACLQAAHNFQRNGTNPSETDCINTLTGDVVMEPK